MALLVGMALGLVLLVAAGVKLASLRSTADALVTFGVPTPARLPLAGAVATVEAALGVGVALGLDAAAYAAAALMTLFAVVLGVALLAGKRGAPCACLGPRSRVSGTAVVRNLVLAGCLAAVPSLPTAWPGPEGWLALGLVAAFVCIVALAIAVLALAREVGILRLRLGTEDALDVAGEGPAVGTRVPLLDRFEAKRDARLALAIFSSDGCRLCESLRPVVAAFRRERVIAVEVFDEVRDADVWGELGIPGSPYAVALELDGTVQAKGTFNSYSQLESIVATAERRLAGAHA